MNNYTYNNEIITALATPYGKSAIAVIRVSGTGCIELVNRYLSCSLDVKKIKLCTFIKDKFRERLMAVAYKAPLSFSGEDTVELFPHGNTEVCDRIIATLIDGGARLAERGEFTKRAFLNGKLDLMQCEALADIIDAQTAEQLYYGNKRYDGEFKALCIADELLKKALSTVEAVLHYGEELEGEDDNKSVISDVLDAIDKAIKELEHELTEYRGGKIIKDGLKITLTGAPNVGKSTLINALIGKERAIVTPIAGTTRDTLDGEYVYNGRKFAVTDTAGLNDKSHDEVEKIGIERARAAAAAADVVVLVVDGTNCVPDVSNYACKIIVRNKCDSIIDVGIDYSRCEKDGELCISAKNGININALKHKLYDICPKEAGALCNHRQYECAVKCLDRLNAAKIEANRADGLELVSALLYEASWAIAELYGEKADENVISAVFERFCVGK